MYNINNLSPYVRLALESKVNYPWIITDRIIFDFELQYIKEGEVLITIEDQEYHGKPGDLFFYKPCQRHSMQALTKSGLWQPHIHFDLNYLSDSENVSISYKLLEDMSAEEKSMIRPDLTEESGMLLPNYIQLINKEQFEEMLFAVIHEFENKLPFSELSLKSLFLKLWSSLLRENYWNTNDNAIQYIPLLISVRDYINTNTSRNITLEELTKKFGISKFHLVRSFKNMFQVSPIHYHHHNRMEKAKTAMQFTNLTLSQIADSLGFESISIFSRSFKNKYGLSPRDFRKEFYSGPVSMS